MENIQKLFLLDKSIGFVVLKTYFSSHCVENCGGDEKVNLVIFPYFSAKREQTGRGSANLHVFQMIYLFFLSFEKKVDKILN
jgi:hypothetical protein